MFNAITPYKWTKINHTLDYNTNAVTPEFHIGGQTLALVRMVRRFETQTADSRGVNQICLSGYLPGSTELRRFKFDFNTLVLQEGFMTPYVSDADMGPITDEEKYTE